MPQSMSSATAAATSAVKKCCSVFDLPPEYFDSCRILQSRHSLWDTPSIETLEDESTVEEPQIESETKGPIKRWSCNTCKAEFDSLFDQRAHFKSDIHRFNIKLSIAGKNTVKEEDFDELTSDTFFEDNDLSSISGSEDEADKGIEAHSGLNSSFKQKLFICLRGGERVSLWKCLLLVDAESISFENEKVALEDHGVFKEREVIEKLKFLIHEPRNNACLRIVLLARGGHFAGCVFDGNEVVAHKTFHRYVIRAKAGKKQSSKDASGKGFHSAGASLRRYNELALKKEIGELLATWKPYFDASSCVFIYAPSSNRQLLFDGEKPNFNYKHGAVRYIPLTVRRPTLKEVKRIYNLLTQVSYEVDELHTISIENELPQSVIISSDNSPKSSKEDLGADMEGTGAPKDRTVVKASEISVSNESENVVVCLSTPLHEASKLGNVEKVLELLEQGLDPCAKDERGRTPYMVTNEKEVRNTFRRYMALNLDQWDWHAANVPSALTKELEEAQAAKQAEKDAKKKARAKELKKLRKAKEKKAQAEAASTQSAATVGGLKLSKEEELKRAQAEEREKRAAAAEKRMAALSVQTGNTKTSTSLPKGAITADNVKCSCCESSLLGKVPFHRYNYKYCSTSCMHVHKEMLEDG